MVNAQWNQSEHCLKGVFKGTGNHNSCTVSHSALLLQKKETKSWSRADVPGRHHALLGAGFVCMMLLCSAAIPLRAFDSSASSSLPFSSEKIFLQRRKRNMRSETSSNAGTSPLILNDIIQYVRRRLQLKGLFTYFFTTSTAL